MKTRELLESDKKEIRDEMEKRRHEAKQNIVHCLLQKAESDGSLAVG